ncbi:hypothetical protein [Pararhizobium qamdonense]
MDAGKHVLVEKPAAFNRGQAAEMVAARAKSRLLRGSLMVLLPAKI